MKKPRIIIVGAGVSGLMAARILSESFRVTLIEHRNVVGGRIRGKYSNDNIIEGGAEFMHGELPLTMQLLKQAGLNYVKAEGRMLRKKGNQLVETSEMVEGWEDFFKKVKKESVDLTLDNFLEKHFADDKFNAFRDEVRRYAMGFDLADPQYVSALSLYNEWSHEEPNYRIKEGYGAMISFLEQECRNNGCEIVLVETVTSVDWHKNNVTVTSASAKKYSAEKILITIPVSLLAGTKGECSISFSGSANAHINASKLIGFGTVIKLIVELKRPFWPAGTNFIFSNELIPTWWTQFPIGDNTLTGWLGGPMADKFADLTDQEIRRLSLISLANLAGISQQEAETEVSEIHVFNWKNYPESRGAYSYATTQTKTARDILNTPIDGTVFFAGEGLYQGQHAGTVEAALSSAMHVSQKIIDSQR